MKKFYKAKWSWLTEKHTLIGLWRIARIDDSSAYLDILVPGATRINSFYGYEFGITLPAVAGQELSDSIMHSMHCQPFKSQTTNGSDIHFPCIITFYRDEDTVNITLYPTTLDPVSIRLNDAQLVSNLRKLIGDTTENYELEARHHELF